MATKKQKRAAGEAKKKQEFMDSWNAGLRAQKRDQENRERQLLSVLAEREKNTHRSKTKGAHISPEALDVIISDAYAAASTRLPTPPEFVTDAELEQARRGVQALIVAMSYEDDDTSTMLDAGCGFGE